MSDVLWLELRLVIWHVMHILYTEDTFELDMLPAQIPLTLEHLFPTPFNSNVRTLWVLFFICILLFYGNSHQRCKITGHKISKFVDAPSV